MGISPAPPSANSYVAIFELRIIFGQFQNYLLLYLRFIDDGIAIWQHGDNKADDNKAFEHFQLPAASQSRVRPYSGKSVELCLRNSDSSVHLLFA